jgi:LmbE family N-acetylglucosaminyl deacetylase
MKYSSFPEDLFAPKTKHLMVFAHQDDEIMYTGLIGRMGSDTRFLWVTNGDGLAPFVDANPREYAEMRKAETDRVLKTLNRPLSRRRCLDFSELDIYDNIVDLTENPVRYNEIMKYFSVILEDIFLEIEKFKPDVVWVPQFQNGHPEHDLTHIFTAYALRKLRAKVKKEIALYQLPEYEYTILVPMRFNPFYKGAAHAITLTDEEVAIKRAAFAHYPSQQELFNSFEKVINSIGIIGKFFGRGFNSEDFISKEVFGPVPDDLDYTESFHRFEAANYIREYHRGVKVSFRDQIAVIARELLPG